MHQSCPLLPASSRFVLTVLLTFVLIVPACRGEGRRTRGGSGEEERLLRKVLEGVERGVEFFASDFSAINLDGLFGLRMGQGQIIEALRECENSGPCPAKVQRHLEHVRDDLELTARAAISYVRELDPAYLQKFQATVNRPYLLPYTPTTLSHLYLTPAGSNEDYDEAKGDLCFARILGTYVENGKKLRGCNVTEECWDMMTAPNRSKYSVTHQLLYFTLIEKKRCSSVVEASTESNVTEWEARLCGSIYNEAVSEVKDGQVSEMYQDLFLEQVLLCGTLGFENFLRADWMKMVLRWQKAIGCFSYDDPALIATELGQSHPETKGKELMKDLQLEVQMIEDQYRSRHLLREQVMHDGCFAHKSGLGFGNLCLYTRYLIRRLFISQ